MSSQNAPQELSDMRISQPVETDQPKAQSSMGKTIDSQNATNFALTHLQIPKRHPKLQNLTSNSVEVAPAMEDFVVSFPALFRSTAGSSLALVVKELREGESLIVGRSYARERFMYILMG